MSRRILLKLNQLLVHVVLINFLKSRFSQALDQSVVSLLAKTLDDLRLDILHIAGHHSYSRFYLRLECHQSFILITTSKLKSAKCLIDLVSICLRCNLVSQVVQVKPISLALNVTHSHREVFKLTNFDLCFKYADDIFKIRHVSLLLEQRVDVGAIDFALKGVSNRSLVRLHLKGLVDLLRVCLTLNHTRNIVEVFLKGAILQFLHRFRVHVLDLGI